MKLPIHHIAFHRNGIGGAPFHAVLFDDSGDEGSRKIAVVFDAPHHVAVLDVAKLAAGDIGFGSNSWRGDRYEPSLRAALRETQDDPPPPDNGLRAARAERILESCRMDDDLHTSLVDLLADAMHWCDSAGDDFLIALLQAGRHYLDELNHQPTDERRLIP